MHKTQSSDDLCMNVVSVFNAVLGHGMLCVPGLLLEVAFEYIM